MHVFLMHRKGIEKYTTNVNSYLWVMWLLGEAFSFYYFSCRVFLQLLSHFYNKTKTKWKKKKPRIFLNITLLNSRAVSVNILFSFSTRNHVKLCGNFCQHTCSGGLKMFSSLFFSLWRIQLYLENCSFLSDAEIIKRCQFHGTALSF